MKFIEKYGSIFGLKLHMNVTFNNILMPVNDRLEATELEPNYSSDSRYCPQKIRKVKFRKIKNNRIGISFNRVQQGGPIIITNIEKDGLASLTGQLVIGDAILSINGRSLSGMN